MKLTLTLIVNLFTTLIYAQETNNLVFITLETGENIPSVDDVYQEGQLAPPPQNHIIPAFETATPLNLKYATTIRAYGDLENLINQKPNWSRSKLERSLILTYSDNANMPVILNILNSDDFIESAFIIPVGELAASSKTSKTKNNQGTGNWHLNAINWAPADALAKGFGNIGFIDTGSLTQRDEFAPFDPSTGFFIGGGLNNSKSFSTYYGDRDISELRAIDENDLFGGAGTCDDFDNNPGDGIVYPEAALVGHGTHVSGLLASRDQNIPGMCQDCFITGTQEVRHECDSNQVKPLVDLSVIAFSLNYLMESGIQTGSFSFGFLSAGDQCEEQPNLAVCLFIADAKSRNIALVAAAGNSREPMRFPASDRDVIGVSGIQEDLQFWNESPTNGQNLPPLDTSIPQNIDDCPFNIQPSPRDVECGSNFSWPDEISPGVFVAERYRRIDVAAPARDVMSTLPLGSEYIPEIGDAGCTDMADGVLDGFGPCTGTSMSTPIIAGILQKIRSVNPLLPIGDDDPASLEGIRDVLLYSGSEFQSQQEHSPWLGYGIPDTEIAIKKVLGISNGQLMKNRVTPLMVLHNEDFNDTTYTVFPQMALANALNPAGFYTNPAGVPPVTELAQYPVEEVDGTPLISLVPLAPIYVFTTPWNPITLNYDLNPLYRMTKETVSVPGCIPGRFDDPTCFVTDLSTVMSTDSGELESFYAQGYELQGIEGYVIPCDNNQCNPGSAAIRIYRVYDDVNDSYYLTQFVPTGDFDVIGAGFLNWDFDGDGLTVGMEYLLGTADNNPDTDGDGLSDGFEYPAAGVPFSDPLVSDIIFQHGFE
ncbi:MAG: S8 family serine peptidase [Marinicella sp.]